MGDGSVENLTKAIQVYVTAAKNFARIIGALMMREAMRRFGRENIGFFWLMGEPLLLTVGVMAVWSMTGFGHSRAIGIIPFALSGYSILTLWRHIIGRSVHCFRNNAGLLFHRKIYFLDPFVATTLLEAVGTGTAFFIAYIPLYLLDFIDPINDPLFLIGAWLLMVWFSFGVGLIIAALTEIVEPAEHFVQPIMYLILPITGTFFMVEWLPEKYQHVAQLSPLIQLNEMFRDGLFGNKVRTYWNACYILSWCIVLTAIGYALAQQARWRIRFE